MAWFVFVRNLRVSHEQIQARYKLKVLFSIPHGLTAEQKATVGSMVVGAGFESEDEKAILEALTHGMVVSARRKQQDGMNFLTYISSHEWNKMKQKIGQEQIANVLLNVCLLYTSDAADEG